MTNPTFLATTQSWRLTDEITAAVADMMRTYTPSEDTPYVLDFGPCDDAPLTPCRSSAAQCATLSRTDDAFDAYSMRTSDASCEELEARLDANDRRLSRLQLLYEDAASERDHYKTVSELRQRAVEHRDHELTHAMTHVRRAIGILQEDARSDQAIFELELLVMRLS